MEFFGATVSVTLNTVLKIEKKILEIHPKILSAFMLTEHNGPIDF